MNTANDELERSVTALLEEFQPEAAPPAVPSTPIAAVDFYRDECGIFLTAELNDGSSVYITLSPGDAIAICHATLPAAKSKPKASQHLFIVRNTAE